MEVVSVKDIEPNTIPNVIMKTLFKGNSGKTITMGTVIIPPGSRVPVDGTGAHDADEYSYIIRGSLKAVSGGKEYRISSGEATFIPAGEAHWSLNDGSEECEIVWVLVSNK